MLFSGLSIPTPPPPFQNKKKKKKRKKTKLCSDVHHIRKSQFVISTGKCTVPVYSKFSCCYTSDFTLVSLITLTGMAEGDACKALFSIFDVRFSGTAFSDLRSADVIAMEAVVV